MSQQFISMKPDPRLVRKALDHCGVPLDYTDEHTVRIPSGPGFDSDGNMTIPEGHVLIDILQQVIDGAMMKYIEDTMVLPSNVAKIRAHANTVGDIAFGLPRADEDRAILEEIAESLSGIADNLDPETKR